MGELLQFRDIRRNARAADGYPVTRVDRAERVTVDEPAMRDVMRYLDDLRRRGFSEATIRRRRTSLSMLQDYLGSDMPIYRAPAALLEDWIRQFPVPATASAYLADVSSYLTWAQRRGLCQENAADRIPRPRVPKPLPRPLTDEEVVTVLVRAEPRARLAFLFGCLAGLRVSEIARLSVEDVVTHPDGQTVIVVRNGKGGKDRVVACHPLLSAHVRATGIRAGYLFPSPRVGAGHLSPKTISTWVRRILRDLGSPRSFHCSRHWHGTRLAALSGGNLLLVAEQLGHSKVETTRGYTAFDRSALSSIVDRIELPGSVGNVLTDPAA